MQEFVEAFGSYNVGSLAVLIAAFVFLYRLYKKAEKNIVDQHDAKKEQDEQIKAILLQEAKYPEWRQQSIEIQSRLTERLDSIEGSQKDLAKRLEEMETDNRKQDRAKLRDRILQAYRYYTSPASNPLQQWSEMEAQAFWDMFGAYERSGGNGHVHTVVQPAMRELIEVKMDDEEKLSELMHSRK